MKLLLILLVSLGLIVASETMKTDHALDDQINDALFNLSLHALTFKANEDNSTVLSPFSVAMALATVNIGARKTTSQEITDVTFGGISKNRITSWFKAKLNELKSDNSPISIASAIYIEKTMNVFESYLADVKDNFQSNVESVDFMHEPKTQRTLINNFVNESTAGHIPELLQEDHVTSATRIIVTNALYMKCSFRTPFKEHRTEKMPFTNEDASVKQIETMYGTHKGRFFENDEFVYGDLPFKEDNFKFFLIIPKLSSLASLKDQLIAGSAKFSAIQSKAEPFHTLHVAMPKFNVSSEIDFKAVMHNLGLTRVFDQADLSGITAHPLSVEYIIHKATLDLEENGVTAAAATAIGFVWKSAFRGREQYINADKPFLYGISHRGTPLFVGQFF